jgi:type IV pilus assembly protein PilM
MDLLPKTLGTRPRLAVEIRPEGVLAARAEDAAAALSAISYGVLGPGSVLPGLKPGNVARRPAVVAAVRKALEAVMLKERQTSLVLPDAAVRVLLLDFDALPAKPAEALPVVRFRLKKLLPFDADDAVVSYQVMPAGRSDRNVVRVAAVAIPREVLAEYESVVREAGFEPGAVLPSTLAALSGLSEDEESTLVVNAGESSVTTAIVEGNLLLLHRMVDFAAEGVELTPIAEVSALPTLPSELLAAPLVDVDSSSAEWTMQQPLSGYGVIDDFHLAQQAEARAARLRDEIQQEFEREFAPNAWPGLSRKQMLPPPVDAIAARAAAAAREVTQAVSVATAYFEDTLQRVPGTVLCTGSLPAGELSALIAEAGFSAQEVRVRAMVDASMLAGGAATTGAPLGWLAGVRGALRS